MTQETAIHARIAHDISASARQVAAAVQLLDDGATVPFVARYRKEATGGLDDTQLRTLSDRLGYLRELEARRATILSSIKDQGKLSDGLAKLIHMAATKSELEDLYLPFKPKRTSKAMKARERGLEPLLQTILGDRGQDPDALASAYLSEAVPTTKDALNGARDILAETLTEDARLLGRLRDFMRAEAQIAARVMPGQEEAGAKYADYFAFSEAWAKIPSHRALAILRGAKETFLTVDIAPDEAGVARAYDMVAAAIGIRGTAPGDLWLRAAAEWAWRTKFSMSMYADLMAELRKRAHEDAIAIFATNLKALLLAAPAGARPTLGLDPGLRTGVKAAVVDATGKLLETATLYPHPPKRDLQGTEAAILRMVQRHGVELIAIGNGTASRETERVVGDALKRIPQGAARPTKVVVSEAGASVYSASELAADEFPDLDVSLRGAVSIARRLQDPLAELVKIEPKAIGVGQYQHDVDQRALARALDAVVEDAVNAVGVDLNMASPALLARVSGLGPRLAEAIVAHRNATGRFASRKALLKVSGLGPKAFEQAAGFLRIPDGDDPLDGSAVHPEAYAVARKIVASCGRDLRALFRDPAPLTKLRAETFVSPDFGLPTVRDILDELAKPGRDPRPEFKTAAFAEGVEDIRDLKPGMRLEGTVTNVAAFGAFVDVGVHQDGLVHVSQLADRFVKDPNEVVKAGDVVRVTVTEVDVPRKRIGLSMRKDGGKTEARQTRQSRPPKGKPPRKPTTGPKSGGSLGGLGAALQDAMKHKRR